jgi:septal ring factor EnvC (AmiA/AmiB activator)
LRLQVTNSNEEEESVRAIQARIAKNENSNAVANQKITKL